MTYTTTIVCGFVGQDPELKNSAQTGTDMCFFTVATRHSTKNESGEWDTQTEWHSIVTYGRLATQAHQYLKKGSRVTVIGRNKTRKWTGKDGIERYKTEVVASTLEFMTNVSDEVAPQRSAPVAQQAMPNAVDSEDIPF